jgi:outer membrane protein
VGWVALAACGSDSPKVSGPIPVTVVRVAPALGDDERRYSAELDEARAAHWPQLQVVGQIGGEHLDSQRSNRSHFNSSAQLKVTIPIFQGFSVQNNIRQAEANLAASRAGLQSQQETVISDVWSAHADFESARAQIEAAESGLASATESFEGSLERYQDGVASIVELMQAQTTLAQSRSQVTESRTNLYDAYASLIYAVGTPAPSVSAGKGGASGSGGRPSPVHAQNW